MVHKKVPTVQVVAVAVGTFGLLHHVAQGLNVPPREVVDMGSGNVLWHQGRQVVSNKLGHVLWQVLHFPCLRAPERGLVEEMCQRQNKARTIHDAQMFYPTCQRWYCHFTEALFVVQHCQPRWILAAALMQILTE